MQKRKKEVLTLAVEKELCKGARENGREWLREQLLGNFRFVWKTDEDCARMANLITLACYEDVLGYEVHAVKILPRVYSGRQTNTLKKIHGEVIMLDGTRIPSSFLNGDWSRYLQGRYDLRKGDRNSYGKWKTLRDAENNFKPLIEKYVTKDDRRIAWHRFIAMRPYSSGSKIFTMEYKLTGSDEMMQVDLYSVNFSHYLSGKCDLLKQGCSRFEKYLQEVLSDANISASWQVTFNGLVGVGGSKLRADGYFTTVDGRRVWIEMDGEQHFKPIPFSGDTSEARKAFEKLQEHDKRKNEYCKDNGIIMIRIPCYDHMTETEVKQALRVELTKHGIIELT